MGEVDSSYRLLFSQARMIRDLLEGFVREDWVRRLDFSSLELQSGSYVSESMKRLEQDFVWKARLDGEDLYVYVLLEVQSRPDPSMALRMLCYLASFYDGLTRQAPGERPLPAGASRQPACYATSVGRACDLPRGRGKRQPAPGFYRVRRPGRGWPRRGRRAARQFHGGKDHD